MKKAVIAFTLAIIMIINLSGCAQPSGTLESSGAGAPDAFQQSQTEEEQEEYKDPSNGQYLAVLESYGESERVKYHLQDHPPENLHLLERWIRNYRSGSPDKVVVTLDNGPHADRVFVLECDGTARYTIAEYPRYMEEEGVGSYLHESSRVVERALDYVFGADFAAGERLPIIVAKKLIYSEDIELDSPVLDGAISYEEAQRIALEQGARLMSYKAVTGGVSFPGIYFSDSIMAEGEARSIEAPDYLDYNVVGAVLISGYPCYVIHEMNYGGNIAAVSADGSMFFSFDIGSRNWVLADDIR